MISKKETHNSSVLACSRDFAVLTVKRQYLFSQPVFLIIFSLICLSTQSKLCLSS